MVKMVNTENQQNGKHDPFSVPQYYKHFTKTKDLLVPSLAYPNVLPRTFLSQVLLIPMFYQGPSGPKSCLSQCSTKDLLVPSLAYPNVLPRTFWSQVLLIPMFYQGPSGPKSCLSQCSTKDLLVPSLAYPNVLPRNLLVPGLAYPNVLPRTFWSQVLLIPMFYQGPSGPKSCLSQCSTICYSIPAWA